MSGIVVGVDLSHHSRTALQWGLTEAALRHAPLTVLSVTPVSAGMFGIAAEHYPADESARKEAAKSVQEFVDKEISQRSDSDVKVTVRVISGLPADELVKASSGADLLVLGARGAGGFSRLVLGSVSSQVSHHALCPIVIIPVDR
jgi:nucleotide-binding universal stress UspA family protein